MVSLKHQSLLWALIINIWLKEIIIINHTNAIIEIERNCSIINAIIECVIIKIKRSLDVQQRCDKHDLIITTYGSSIKY